MANMKPDHLSDTSEKVATKAATLVETAADLAEQAFETAVDKTDLASATTSTKLVKNARRTNKLIHKHARKIGVGTLIGGTLATLGAIIVIAGRARSKRSQD